MATAGCYIARRVRNPFAPLQPDSRYSAALARNVPSLLVAAPQIDLACDEVRMQPVFPRTVLLEGSKQATF